MEQGQMLSITIHGVRGSLPATGKNFLKYGGNTTDYDMANLFGKRMVVGDELSRDRSFNESLLKKFNRW